MNSIGELFPKIDKSDIPDGSIIIGEAKIYDTYRPIGTTDLCAYVADLIKPCPDTNKSEYFGFRSSPLNEAHQTMLSRILSPGNNHPMIQDYFTFVRKHFCLTLDEICDSLDKSDSKTLREWVEIDDATGIPIMSKGLFNLVQVFKKMFTEIEAGEYTDKTTRDLFFKMMGNEDTL